MIWETYFCGSDWHRRAAARLVLLCISPPERTIEGWRNPNHSQVATMVFDENLIGDAVESSSGMLPIL